jgi:rubrerythrin
MDITNEELLEISLKIERGGKAFYDSLSTRVKDPEVKDFLTTMSKEEALHEKQFIKMLEAKANSKYGWEENSNLRSFITDNFETDIFPNLDKVFDQLSNFEGIQKAFEFAIETERVSHEFYGMLGELCSNYEVKTLLILLEKAEVEHLQRIKSLREKFIATSS